MIHRARVFLIELGKMLPFIVCGIICISYMECVYALFMEKFVVYDGSFVLYKPISWALGSAFEYNLITVTLMAIISVAVQTCLWNKLGVFYTLVQLGEKSYFDFELEITTIYIICLANIIVAGYLTYKGLHILINKH